MPLPPLHRLELTSVPVGVPGMLKKQEAFVQPAKGTRDVQIVSDYTFTSRHHNYHIRSYNCATLVRHVLGSFGINCVWRATSWAITFDQPSCSASSKDFQVGTEESEAMIKLFDETPRPQSLEMLRDWSTRITDVYVMRNLKFKEGAYHVGLFCVTTNAEGQTRCLSFSGWPNDTIKSFWQLGLLFSGAYTVAFPDPGMANDPPGQHTGMRALVKIPGGVKYAAAPIAEAALKTLGYDIEQSALVENASQRADRTSQRRECTVGEWMQLVISQFYNEEDWIADDN